MKLMIFLLCFFLLNCGVTSFLDPNPSTNHSKNVYVQGWLESQNLTTCHRFLDLELDINGFGCKESETDTVYFIPYSKWYSSKLNEMFVLYSKSQVDALLAKKDFFCEGEAKEWCKTVKPVSLVELKDYIIR